VNPSGKDSHVLNSRLGGGFDLFEVVGAEPLEGFLFEGHGADFGEVLYVVYRRCCVGE